MTSNPEVIFKKADLRHYFRIADDPPTEEAPVRREQCGQVRAYTGSE
jgi:hypothetical protein